VNLQTGTADDGFSGRDRLIAIESVIGSNFDDQLIGNEQANTLMGVAGNDFLIGGAGADILDGGDGIDTAAYTASSGVAIDLQAGTASGGDATGDVLISIENLISSGQDDTLSGNDSDNSLAGGDGNDSLAGRGGNDTLDGGNGDDTLDGGTGNDLMNGGDGNDLFLGGAGNDVIDGGAGSDTVSYQTSPEGVVVNLDAIAYTTAGVINLNPPLSIPSNTALDGFGSNDLLQNIENIIGTANSDVLIGNGEANRLQGLAGDDLIIGSGGSDVLEGGAGTDTLSYHADAAGITVNLQTGTAIDGSGSTDQVSGFENLVGSTFGDTLTGNNGNNLIQAGDGDDTVNGGAGDDTLIGNSGNDILNVGTGRDRVLIHKGDGTDRVIGFNGIGRGTSPSNAAIAALDVLQFEGDGLTARNMILNQVGSDLVITFEGVANTSVVLQNFALENLDNLPVNGTLTGNILFSGDQTPADSFDVLDASFQNGPVLNTNRVTFLNDRNNVVQGFNNSADVINGLGGNDQISGLSGDDLLRGGDGNDRLDGGLGLDQVSGGAGQDTFVLAINSGADVILDFQTGVDRIDLTGTLTFGNITIQQGTGGDAANVFINRAGTGDRLATLLNVNVVNLTAASFV
ncbi:MAG TPA: calcium-binding protein, partial [Crinalium sp.]